MVIIVILVQRKPLTLLAFVTYYRKVNPTRVELDLS